jgi:septal ring factor EnvC (AmiA/AmiB activator)
MFSARRELRRGIRRSLSPLTWRLAGPISIPALAIVVTAAIASPSPAGAAPAADANLRRKSSELDSIKTELERGRRRLKSLQKEEGTHLAQIEQLSVNIHTSERYLATLTRRIDSLDAQIRGLEDSLAAARNRLARRQEAMALRLRAMYMADPLQRPQGFRVIEAAVTARSIPDMLYRVRYFQELARYDQVLLRQIDSARADLGARKKRLEERRAETARLRDGKRAEQQQLAAEQDQHRRMLEDVRARKAAYLGTIKQLEESQRQLAAIIKRLMAAQKRTKRAPASGQAAAADRRKGTLPWPMRGTVVQEFGKIVHPVYKTVTMSNGIDIAGTPGQPVTCVAPGRVIYVGSMRGLGNLLMVEHSDGILTIYANLVDVGVKSNQQVAQGAVLGTAGRGATAAESKLHFEIRKFSDALDPREWLR